MAPGGITTARLGSDGPLLPRLGLGLMGQSFNYGTSAPVAERLKFLDEAYALGETFWDTADKYADSEDLIGTWIKANPMKREDIFLATKFGLITKQEAGTAPKTYIDSSPEYCFQAIENSLRRLCVSYVDIYYVHRLDKVTPIEKTIEALADLKKAGKINHIGLCECSAESLRRAHAVHPITCVQMEYSPFCVEIEKPERDLLRTARELGVGVVAASPMANGLLTGSIKSPQNVKGDGDIRSRFPWMSEENFPHNLGVINELEAIAESKKCSIAQLTLAWLLAQGLDIFPIPGSSNIKRLEQNLASLSVELTSGEERQVRDISKKIKGLRINALTGLDFGDTPELPSAS